MAIYYICLQIYCTAIVSLEPHRKPHPYLHPPTELVNHVTKYVSSTNESDWSDEIALLVGLLRKYQEYLMDHTQAQLLLGLGLGMLISLLYPFGCMSQKPVSFMSNVTLNICVKFAGNVFTTYYVVKHSHLLQQSSQ